MTNAPHAHTSSPTRLSPLGVAAGAAPSAPSNAPLGSASDTIHSLHTLQADGQSCALSERPFTSILNLRGNASDSALVQAIASVTGLALPTTPNTTALRSPHQLLWLGPDEWLLKSTPEVNAAELEASLRGALQGQHASVVQVGDGYTTLHLQGAGAASLLSRGCPLDLHPRHFTQGAVAQSHIAKANATILCLAAGVTFEITVRRSFARYVVEWLAAAGQG